jgi:hemerythrin-like domain-containing protein
MPQWWHANEPTDAPMQPDAVALILQDHQALAAVLRALREAVERAAKPGAAPDFEALRTMLFYLDEMPGRVHHAAESGLLFPRIRERCPALHPVLDRLEDDHERSEAAVRELERALSAWEVMGEARRESCQLLLQTHARVYLGHMEVEENYVLPVAQDYLSPLDWRELADALTAQRNEHDASLLRGHQMLFERITSRFNSQE